MKKIFAALLIIGSTRAIAYNHVSSGMGYSCSVDVVTVFDHRNCKPHVTQEIHTDPIHKRESDGSFYTTVTQFLDNAECLDVSGFSDGVEFHGDVTQGNSLSFTPEVSLNVAPIYSRGDGFIDEELRGKVQYYIYKEPTDLAVAHQKQVVTSALAKTLSEVQVKYDDSLKSLSLTVKNELGQIQSAVVKADFAQGVRQIGVGTQIQLDLPAAESAQRVLKANVGCVGLRQ